MPSKTIVRQGKYHFQEFALFPNLYDSIYPICCDSRIDGIISSLLFFPQRWLFTFCEMIMPLMKKKFRLLLIIISTSDRFFPTAVLNVMAPMQTIEKQNSAWIQNKDYIKP